MALLEDLQSIVRPGHTLTIRALDKDSYFRKLNKQIAVKHVYTIHIDALDSTAGQNFVKNGITSLKDIAPSKLSYQYHKEINDVLDKYSNGKLYITCCSECGTNLDYDIVWNKDRRLR